MMLGLFNKRLFAIVLLACLAAACDDDDPTVPNTPTVLPKTESFSTARRRTTSTLAPPAR
jgi:hypothetical protein